MTKQELIEELCDCTDSKCLTSMIYLERRGVEYDFSYHAQHQLFHLTEIVQGQSKPDAYIYRTWQGEVNADQILETLGDMEYESQIRADMAQNQECEV